MVGLVLFGAGIGLVSTFEPPSETEKWWPDEHMFTKFLNLIDNRYKFIAVVPLSDE